MRKLIMWNIISLDGYFEGNEKWDLPFHLRIWGPELEKFSIDQLNDMDYLVFGRVTWAGMAEHWKKETGEIARLMNAMPKLVASNSLVLADWNQSTILSGDVASEISRIKKMEGKDMYVFGSADLSETLIREDIFDEYRIGIAPVVLGSGNPLFRTDALPKNLSLVSSWTLETGGVILTYRPRV